MQTSSFLTLIGLVTALDPRPPGFCGRVAVVVEGRGAWFGSFESGRCVLSGLVDEVPSAVDATLILTPDFVDATFAARPSERVPRFDGSAATMCAFIHRYLLPEQSSQCTP